MQLVSYFNCMFWIGNTPTPSWLFITDQHLAFLPKFYKRRHKALVELTQVSAIDKETSKTAIVVKTKDGGSYSFTSLKRATIYRVLVTFSILFPFLNIFVVLFWDISISFFEYLKNQIFFFEHLHIKFSSLNIFISIFLL